MSPRCATSGSPRSFWCRHPIRRARHLGADFQKCPGWRPQSRICSGEQPSVLANGLPWSGVISPSIRLGKPLHDLWMRFEPQRSRGAGRIESELLPPCRFIPVTMHFTMMSPAQRDRELITGLAPECPVLREAQMMGIAGLTSADQAGLLGDKPHMIAIANAAWLGMAQDGFIDRGRWHLGLCFPLASICCRRAL
jgi:hypothetical protein